MPIKNGAPQSFLCYHPLILSCCFLLVFCNIDHLNIQQRHNDCCDKQSKNNNNNTKSHTELMIILILDVMLFMHESPVRLATNHLRIKLNSRDTGSCNPK